MEMIKEEAFVIIVSIEAYKEIFGFIYQAWDFGRCVTYEKKLSNRWFIANMFMNNTNTFIYHV